SIVAACSSDSTAPAPKPVAVNCTAQPILDLSPGDHAVIDPAATNDCLRLPAAGAQGAEYLVVGLSTTGEVTASGIAAPFRLASWADTPATAMAARSEEQVPASEEIMSPAARFHAMLRARGRSLARQALLYRAAAAPRVNAAPPALGSTHNFQVCGDANCNGFVTVTATAVHVGPHNVIYLDNAAPAGGYSTDELDRLGGLFDEYMYPIDTTAFGRETDIDGNGAVDILLSPAVNHLSGNCNATNSVIGGFFFPDDLLPGSAGSNAAEVFYGLVPNPNSTTCTISHAFASDLLGPTFLHEFQHMISFGRHVLLPPVPSDPEDNWLDEGLSRFAEELGGREIPDSFCTPRACSSQFPNGDLYNAFTYLDKTKLEATPLIEPGNVDGTLANNGANWLFVRWLADHFATDSILGTSLTRALDGADAADGTVLIGSSNVATTTGADFSTLIGEWQMANYLTALVGFSEPTGRLRYKSIDLGAIYRTAFGYYPLIPDSTATLRYSHTGVLKPGSGRHLLIVEGPSAQAEDLSLTDPYGAALDPSLIARFAITRIR
ncbi:MAG TPA: hypothetical protein VMJ30_04615, partial [Gemmatimonadales bacterium]|nr:hypothetical protein [Gemmatimonadales bacterium]